MCRTELALHHIQAAAKFSVSPTFDQPKTKTDQPDFEPQTKFEAQ
jgi:hypothetical protein